MTTIVQDTNVNGRWTGHIVAIPDPAVTLYTLYAASEDAANAYKFVEQKANPAGTPVVGEAVGTGNGVQTVFNLAHNHVYTPSAVVRVNAVVKTQGVDYTLTSAGVLTFVVPPPNAQAVTADYSYGADLTFGPYTYGALHIVPSRKFFLKATSTVNGKQSEKAAEASLSVTPTAQMAWTRGELLGMGVNPIIVVGYDPVTDTFYPLNVITDGGTGFKLKT